VGRLNYDIQLHEFIDSDWVGSVYGISSANWICFSLIFSTMSWASRKHKFVAINTLEEKYISSCDACTKAIWLQLCEAFR
jgi:hypothetical protein